MAKKATTKVQKSKASKATNLSRSKSLRTVATIAKESVSLGQNSSSNKYVRRDSVAGKFIAAKTGRVIKSSPAKPRLGKERIQTAVRNYVRRDTKTGSFSE